MIVRQWKTTFDESRKTELVAYANEVSLPTLSTRPGCVGVAFLSSGNRWITQTIWRNQASIDALAEDKDYDRIVDGILTLGLLGDCQTTSIFSYEGGTALSQPDIH